MILHIFINISECLSKFFFFAPFYVSGVYQVNIDSDQQKVTVLGCVDSATLIKKLLRAGKHAELWSQKTNQSQKQKNNCIKDDKNSKGQKQSLGKGLETFKNQHKFSAFSSEEDDDYFDDDEEDDEEDELRFLREKASQLGQLGLLRQQQAMGANNAKKVVGAIAGAPNNGKMNNIVANGNGGNKGVRPNQNNMGMKDSPGGIDQKTMASLKMNNAHLVGAGNINAGGEAKRASDLSAMMSLAGFHGNAPNVSSAGALGGTSSGLGGGFQVQPNNGYQASSGAFPCGGYATGQYPSSMMMNMNGYNHPSSMTNMNMNMQQARHAMQQPQMLYHRSPLVPPSTGYYYNYNPYSPPYSYPHEPYYNTTTGDNSAAHMFSDENTSSCSIM